MEKHAERQKNCKRKRFSLVFPSALESHHIKTAVHNVLNYFQLTLFVSLS